jgi:GNAT superfamily N-acetyltransferase
MAVEIVRSSDPAVVEELRPLWLALRDHHHGVAPELGPVRSDEATWERRGGQYAHWLATDPRNFVLLARDDDGRAVGYAFARVYDSDSATWDLAGAILDVETLSVLPAARGGGIGSKLLGLLRDEVARCGYARLELTVVAGNRDARRFYEREGLAETFVILRDTRSTP